MSLSGSIYRIMSLNPHGITRLISVSFVMVQEKTPVIFTLYPKMTNLVVIATPHNVLHKPKIHLMNNRCETQHTDLKNPICGITTIVMFKINQILID